ncbi:MAG: hypothetical protein MZV70_02105 [Desulfobacterales bacterium]|nr:hypothetical protein [Desulfobacterales bacterium]
MRSYPVRDEKGILTGVVEIVTDITERRRAEEAMRQSEQKYRELFEHANDIIFILDFDGRSCHAMPQPPIPTATNRSSYTGMGIEELLDRDYLPVNAGIHSRDKSTGVEVHNPREFLTWTKDRGARLGGDQCPHHP